MADDELDDLIAGLATPATPVVAPSEGILDDVLDSLDTATPPPEHDPVSPPAISQAVDAPQRPTVTREHKAFRVSSVIGHDLEGATAWENRSNQGRRRIVVSLVAMVAIIAFVGAALWTQTDIFHPERAQQKIEARERERQKAHQEFLEQQEKSGQVVIQADRGEGAVWLWLGVTPLDTMKLSSRIEHQVRFVHPEYAEVDATVSAEHWRGDSVNRRGELVVTMKPGKASLPPYPPAPERSAPPELSGSGKVHIESKPAGVSVWLLVGFTPHVEVSLVAGKPYRFMVRYSGQSPAEVDIPASEWFLSGRKGPMKTRIERRVTLDQQRATSLRK